MNSNAINSMVVLILILLSRPVISQQQDSEKLDFFESKIRPVLVEHCYQCHSSQSAQIQGGLLVDSREAIRVGGDSGPGVVPGQPSESLILDALHFDSFEMPPDGQLKQTVIEDFEKWIADGAVDPRESSSNSAVKNHIDLEKGRAFWSFQPIQNPPAPPVKDWAWCRTPVDQFVLEQLELRQAQPGADATKQQLVRRIYFDLIGLPPTPEQTNAFVQDNRPDALPRLVDELLALPQFGERWARHWLDIARYSDSSGGGRVLIFHEAWRYRDYVIRAFNADKPYDEFVREQIAGDLLNANDPKQRAEQVTATGFLAMGPHNYELQDKELLQMEIVDEQIDVTGRAVLGMTLGCVRCHDHKFDPIPIEDYYALAGIFRSTDSVVNANVSRFVETEISLPEPLQRKFESYQLQQKQVADELLTAKNRLNELTGARDGVAIDSEKLAGTVIDDENAKRKGEWRTGTLKPFVDKGYRYSTAPNSQAVFEFRVPVDGKYNVRVSYTAHPNRSAKTPVTITYDGESQEISVNQRVTPKDDGVFQTVHSFHGEKGNELQVLFATSDDGCSIIDAVQLLAELEPAKGLPNAVVESDQAEIRELESQIATLMQQQKKLKQSAPARPPKVMSVRENKKTGDYFVCIRGDAHKLGDPVVRGGLSVLPNANFMIGENSSGRLELSEWMLSSENPLTARVYVNRIWQHLFGEGLVRTPDNFGSMGARPTHPELLDYLATQFVKQGWSTKKLIRQLVLSRVYGLAADFNKDVGDFDLENRWLARANRRRLDVEAIRDAMLRFSGELDLTSYGPTMDQGLKREFGYQYKTLRRTIYVPIFRNTLNDMLDLFDFPNPNLVSGRRNESTLPSQALYMMNSPFVLQRARSAAQRVISVEGEDSDRIDFAYQHALSRLPTPAERQVMIDYLSQFELDQELQREQAWTEICHTLISCLDFRFLN